MAHALSPRLAGRLGLRSDEARRALLLGLILFALTGSFPPRKKKGGPV